MIDTKHIILLLLLPGNHVTASAGGPAMAKTVPRPLMKAATWESQRNGSRAWVTVRRAEPTRHTNATDSAEARMPARRKGTYKNLTEGIFPSCQLPVKRYVS